MPPTPPTPTSTPDPADPADPTDPTQGGLVYGHYGRPQDLELLRARGVTLGGQLLLLRMGKGTPAAKVRWGGSWGGRELEIWGSSGGPGRVLGGNMGVVGGFWRGPGWF